MNIKEGNDRRGYEKKKKDGWGGEIGKIRKERRIMY